MRTAGAPASRIAAVCNQTSSRMSNAPSVRVAGQSRYGSGSGDPAGRCSGARNGASASSVTTQGEIVLPKFLDRNGPSGWYSQGWMSRADQSFTRHTPKRC